MEWMISFHPTSISLTPNGNQVYVTGGGQDDEGFVAWFDRDAVTGGLTLAKILKDGEEGG